MNRKTAKRLERVAGIEPAARSSLFEGSSVKSTERQSSDRAAKEILPGKCPEKEAAMQSS